MRGTFIVFKPNRKGGLDVRTMEGKRGEIIKRRGKFNAVLTRDVSIGELQAITGFVAHKNGDV